MKKQAGSSQQNLKQCLEQVLKDFPPASRTGADPVQFPRKLFEQGRPVVEIEAAALFSAMLAYGSAAQFIKKIHQVMESCNWQFFYLITAKNPQSFAWPGYRLSTASEIGIFAPAIGRVCQKNGSLKRIFLSGFEKNGLIKEGLIAMQQAMCAEVIAINKTMTRGIRHLLPDPSSGGCAKRWHMFLRWMVRPDDGVDMHLWPEIPPGKLLIPLDRHISRISRNLGLTERCTDDWKTAEEISQKLREMAPDDPIRYDFSLCHLGIAGECTHGKDQQLCRKCLLAKVCKAFKS